MPDPFEQFEDVDVVESTISVRKAGDGLSSALAVEPRAYHRGDKVYVILETTCDAVTYRNSKNFDGVLAREHILTTEHGAIVSGQAVAKLLNEAKKEQKEYAAREAERKAAEKGRVKLPGTKLEDLPEDDD